MNTKIQDSIIKAGFIPPTQEFKKTDPRGREYGFFTASWTECSGMEVTKYSSREKIEYSMTFGCFEDFEAWASDCT